MKINIQSIVSFFAAAVLTTSVAVQAADGGHGDSHGGSGGHHFVPKAKPAPTTPSPIYSGSSAIDPKNGVFFSKGTFGVPNAVYEAEGKTPTWAVSLAEKEYAFSKKEHFVKTLNERIQHFEHALWNYSKVTDASTAAGKAHADKMIADLSPRVEKARAAWSEAKSAGESAWEEKSNSAKRAFLDLQSFSYSAHKNVPKASAASKKQ